MNEEATQKKVLEEIQKMGNPGDTGYDAVKNAKHTDESDNALKAENDKFTQATTGATDPVSGQKSSWQQAMASGWFEPISRGGCSPVTWEFAGYTTVIDICEPADKISNIFQYCLWFMIGVGAFVMFTGGQVRSS
jgi:hypothetical protein